MTRRAQKAAPLTARTANRHALYQSAVQDPDNEVRILTGIYRGLRGSKPLMLREDFCGTALLCSKWVTTHRDRRAVGVDIDDKVVAWGKRTNVDPLGELSERVRLVVGDVRNGHRGKYDVIVGLNYSYFTFATRPALKEYFRAARRALKPDGLLVLDAYGGPDAQETGETVRRERGFTYIWDQNKFNPIDNSVVNYIHFKFRDGSEMKRAFTYKWRLWSLMEVQELLREAGFTEVHVYWEDEDEDGDASGVFRRRRRAENDPAWNAYIVAGIRD